MDKVTVGELREAGFQGIPEDIPDFVEFDFGNYKLETISKPTIRDGFLTLDVTLVKILPVASIEASGVIPNGEEK